MNTKRQKFSLKAFLKLFYDSKIPWIPFVVITALNFYVSKLSIDTFEYIAQIMEGNFFDTSLITKFIISSTAIALTGVPTIFLSWIIINFQKRAQQRVWNKLISLPLKRIDELDPTSLTSRVTNDAAFTASFLTYLGNILISFYTLYLATNVLFEKSKDLSIYVIPIIIVSVITSFIFANFAYKVHHKIQDIDSQITKFFNERLSSIKLIKSSTMEEKEYFRGIFESKKKLRAQNYKTIYDSLWTGYQSAITAALKGVVLIVGATLVVNAELDPGDYIAFFTLIAIYPGNMQSFFGNCISLVRIFGQSQVVSNINSEADEKLSRDISPVGILGNSDINFENVSFGYDTNDILKNINLSIKAGEHVAIVGPSGSGKSTVLKLIERFYDSGSGDISLAGEKVERYHLDEWRKTIGYVSQNTVLLPGTVKTNILYGVNGQEFDIDDETIINTLKILNLNNDIENLSNGIDTFVGDLGDRLSAGQKQRVAIARAIINDPEILIMDEATANLDVVNEKNIMQNILSMRKGKTTIIVSHNLNIIKDVDKIVVVDSGVKLAEGKHEELLNSCSLYKQLLGE